jgi:PIN domain nuclease of toxin-antitoxin system
MSRVLLDTHAFMWWVDMSSQVKPEWLELVLDAENVVYVSAVTAWEIEIKKRSGKLRFGHDVAEVASQLGFEHLSITMQHATSAGSLDWDHQDPFDRMLVAQARDNAMTLLSADKAMKSAPGVRVL